MGGVNEQHLMTVWYRYQPSKTADALFCDGAWYLEERRTGARWRALIQNEHPRVYGFIPISAGHRH